MLSSANRGLVYRFGVFEVFAESREIFRQGHRVKMQEQPFEFLLLLLEHPGEVVDREQLRLRLWPGDTFVDFNQSLSAAVTKLRQALGDDANNPRFIETIPRRGYRFLAPVTRPEELRTAPAAESTPQVSVPAPELSQTAPPAVWSRKVAVLLAIVGLAAAVVIALHQRKKAFALATTDTVVLADFENHTGEAIFNDTLREALIVGLAQSPIVHLLPDRTLGVVFKQMGHTPDDRMSGLTAIELCKRVGGKVTVQGSISNLGTTYLIGLAAIRCDTGKPVAHEQAEAQQRNDVIDALGQATARLRARLGESLPTIEKYNAPLEQATTSSLEALEAYNQALSTWDAKGDLASIPYFKQAIAIDPDFAMAHGALAAVYHNTGNAELAQEQTMRAYNLRDRVTGTEKAAIEARYYLYNTEEIEKAALTYAALVQDYPDSANSLNHLGTADMQLGRNEQAAVDFRKALHIDPTRGTTYDNLALVLLRLDRPQEAQAVLAEAEKRGLRNDYWVLVHYWLAFLNGDQQAMASGLPRSDALPGAQAAMLSEMAGTEAASGHFQEAFRLSQSAASLAQKAGDAEGAASMLAEGALLAGEGGFPAQAKTLLQQAAALSNAKVVATARALVSAQIGDLDRAGKLATELDKQYPQGSFVQKFWLPLVRGEVAIHQGNGTKAAESLSAAEPLDPSIFSGFSVSPLYPTYVRGLAYLLARDGARAAEQFRNLIDHRGMVLNSPLTALAYLGQARAYALAQRMADAGQSYQQFFRLWKDADPQTPVLRQARLEANRLQPAR
jgi:DNA-binding winged helix-turn-helix (wHTH) protein/tetratricopeptide (TPR) repeat protein